jgi:hypothetical protein
MAEGERQGSMEIKKREEIWERFKEWIQEEATKRESMEVEWVKDNGAYLFNASQTTLTRYIKAVTAELAPLEMYEEGGVSRVRLKVDNSRKVAVKGVVRAV